MVRGVTWKGSLTNWVMNVNNGHSKEFLKQKFWVLLHCLALFLLFDLAGMDILYRSTVKMLNWIGHEVAALSLHTTYSFSFDMAQQTWKLVLVMDDLRNKHTLKIQYWRISSHEYWKHHAKVGVRQYLYAQQLSNEKQKVLFLLCQTNMHLCDEKMKDIYIFNIYFQIATFLKTDIYTCKYLKYDCGLVSLVLFGPWDTT